MTDEDKPPVISLAAARAERERDFTQERADLVKELEDIGVASDQLALRSTNDGNRMVSFQGRLDAAISWPRPGCAGRGRVGQIDSTGKMKALAGNVPVHQLRVLLERFFQQRQAAKQRGVVWQLDFWTWLEIWQTSGHLLERQAGASLYGAPPSAPNALAHLL